jgi:thymidine phosphorylase
MSQVLGRSVGNALEISEVIEYLKDGNREPRLHEVVITLGAELLLLAGVVENLQAGEMLLNERLDDGSAAEIFAQMVSALGGPVDLLQNPQAYLPQAPVVCPVYANQSGKISAFDVRSVGNAIVELGGGRRRVIDAIDYGVGLTEVKSIGESVSPDIPIAFVHAATQDSADSISAKLQAAITIEESASMANPVILKRLKRQQVLQ